jgi:hypothetical protein
MFVSHVQQVEIGNQNENLRQISFKREYEGLTDE